MVDTSLNRKYKASDRGQINYDPVPEGWYTLKVKSIDDWINQVKTIKVNLKDENNNVIKDENGKNLTEVVNDCSFYNAKVIFEVVDGLYKGKNIFHQLTTHPNMNWTIDNFLYAVGKEELQASNIKNCVGLVCLGNVYVDTYTKNVENKKTGMTEEIYRDVNRIRSLKPIKDNLNTQYSDSVDNIIDNI